MSISKITPATLTWDESGLPRSSAFNDLYFSAENGLEETRYVFLKGNKLEERWKDLSEGESFVICETGFGSGLNLLAAAELWQRTAPSKTRLHFISTELYPMTRADLERTHRHWPELAPFVQKFLDNYPPLTPGFHRFELAENISVTLIFDEIISGLSSLCPTLATEMWDYRNWNVDAWFLDGFAPSENPEMWADSLFPLINRLSSETATAATFTCAGVVKRGLQAWGFDIEKIPGFGRKREMLVAKRNTKLKIDLESQKQPHRKASPCWHLDAVQAEKPESVAIIGAGIAGCTTAEAVSRRGIKTTLIDAGDIASGASGNPHAALYARLSPNQGDLEDFCLHALDYAYRFYRKQLTSPQLGQVTGLIQLEKSRNDKARMEKTSERFSNAQEFVTYKAKHQLSELSGLQLGSGGLWFPNSGWVNGPMFCQHLAQVSDAEILTNTPITGIESDSGCHQLFSEDSLIGEFDAVVIAAGMNSMFHPPASWLPVRPIRGQITFLHNQPETRSLKTVLCRETYLTPSVGGHQSVGATYDLDTNSNEINAEDHWTNIAELQKLLGMSTPINTVHTNLQGRASTRTTTPDYLPIVGTLPNIEEFNRQYALWRKDRKRAIPEPHTSYTGIYLNLGYGSRGYSYAPLCAELLAAKIFNEPEPVSTKMQRTLNPTRFLVRALSKGKQLI